MTAKRAGRKTKFRVGQVVCRVKASPGLPIGSFGQLIRYEAIKRCKFGPGMWEVAYPFRKVTIRWAWSDELRPLSAKETGQRRSTHAKS